MRRNILSKTNGLLLIGAISFGAACNQPLPNTTVTTNSNSNAMNSNLMNSSQTNASSSNANMSLTPSAAIETKEPEQYQATVSLKFEIAGAQSVNVPPIKADVARSGADRRMEFVLPNGDKLIYLDTGGKQFVISPNRKQYAELTKEATGMEIRKLLLPEQIVNQVKNMKGVERVGEEKFGDRDVIKYRYGATTSTQTKAGTVATESIILVDKETSLPLKSATRSQSQDGNVQGIQGVNFITEMSNIRTTVDAAMFSEPTDMQKVAPEQIKQQIDAVFSVAVAFLGQMMKSVQAPVPSATQTP